MSARTLLACCSILSSAALAQGRVLVVDRNGGGQFTDLPAAVAAANPGDVLRVRPGTYTPFTINKGISILGEPSVVVGNLFNWQCLVTGVPATETVVLARLSFFPCDLRIEHCAGPVLIQDVSVSMGVAVRSGGQVQISGSTLKGLPGFGAGTPPLDVANSVVAITDSSLDGGAASGRGHGWMNFASPGVQTSASSVSLSRCRVTGGRGFLGGLAPSFPAVSSQSSTIWLYGTGGEAVQAQGPDAVPGISLSGGALVMDQVVPVSGFGGALPIVGTGTVTRTWLPSLQVRSAPPGGSLWTGLFSPVGDLVLQVVSTPMAPLSATTGLLWVDPTRLLVLGVGVQGASRH